MLKLHRTQRTKRFCRQLIIARLGRKISLGTSEFFRRLIKTAKHVLSIESRPDGGF